MFTGAIILHILFVLELEQNPQRLCNSNMGSLLKGVNEKDPLESVVPQLLLLVENALISVVKSLSSKIT